MTSIVFIDTNIWLDFYRVRGQERALAILDHIKPETHDRFITSAQVEMEFKKNRQRVILDSHSKIKAPDFEGLRSLPAFLADSKQSSGITTSGKRVQKLATTLKRRTERVLRDPSRHDPVYKIAQRLFRAPTQFNLTRNDKVRFEIRRLARKRFILGYPPRKDSDTSIGDAINWEWIVRCAEKSGENVVIVSRDRDYGERLDGELVLNDWLAQEFHERVSRRRKIVLTDRLAEGLKLAGISVSKAEEKIEEEFLEEGKVGSSDAIGREEPAFQRRIDLAGHLGRVPARNLADLRERLELLSRSSELQQLTERIERVRSLPQIVELSKRLNDLPSLKAMQDLTKQLESPELKEQIRRIASLSAQLGTRQKKAPPAESDGE